MKRWIQAFARRWCGHGEQIVAPPVERLVYVDRPVDVDRPIYLDANTIATPSLPLGRFRVFSYKHRGAEGKLVCSTHDGSMARRYFESTPLAPGQQLVFWDGAAQRGARNG